MSSVKHNKTLEELSKLLVNNADFLANVEKDVETMKEDGKIDFKDIPTLVSLLVLCYNELDEFHVTLEELPELLVAVAKLILEKYDLVPEGNAEQYEALVQSAIQLVVLMPKVKKCCGSCLGKVNKLFKCLTCS